MEVTTTTANCHWLYYAGAIKRYLSFRFDNYFGVYFLLACRAFVHRRIEGRNRHRKRHLSDREQRPEIHENTDVRLKWTEVDGIAQLSQSTWRITAAQVVDIPFHVVDQVKYPRVTDRSILANSISSRV